MDIINILIHVLAMAVGCNYKVILHFDSVNQFKEKCTFLFKNLLWIA
jgi:hypothetical protein